MSQKTSDHRSTTTAKKKSTPVYLVDAAGKVQYVLVPAEQYQQVRSLPESDQCYTAQTYPLQERVAHTAGWDDPEMAAYDHYDIHRKHR